MSADVDSGMTVGDPAWHKLDKNYGHGDYPRNWPQARKRAGLDWDVLVRESLRQRPHLWQTEEGEPRITELATPEAFELYNSKTGAYLSTQPDSYVVIGMDEIGTILEYVFDVADEDNYGDDLKIETLFSLQGGKQIICTVRLEQPFQIPGDDSLTFPFFCLNTRHDGRGGVRLGENMIREVCANTAGAAERVWDVYGNGVTIRHTANWTDRLADVRESMRIATDNQVAMREFMFELADRPLSAQDVRWFLNRWGYTHSSSSMGEVARRNMGARRARYREILESVTCQSVNSTMYGALMAATQMCDHEMVGPTTTMETRASRQLMRGSVEKKHAFALWAQRAKTKSRTPAAQMRRLEQRAYA